MNYVSGILNLEEDFLIHASKTPDSKAIKGFGFKDLPCGFIVGEAELINVKHYISKEDNLKDKDLHLVNSG